MGSRYLRILAPNFLFMAVSFTFASILRTTGDVKIPMAVSMLSIALNTFLSYGLIFGRLGLPEMGFAGAALALTIARVFDAGLLVFIAYRRRTAAAAKLREMFSFDRPFAVHVLSKALPVTINEIFWSLGFSAYNAIYARIGTEAIAAVNISASIESLAFVVFIGITDATGILVGHRIGSGEEHKAQEYAWKSLRLAWIFAVLIGLAILGGSNLILSLYKVAPIVAEYGRRLLTIFGLTLWVRVSNLMIIVGILRAGGDTRFAVLLDTLSVWGVGVPAAFLGGFVLHLPVYGVYLLVLVEEAVKLAIGLARFFSRKWVHNLTTGLDAPLDPV
jgi:putative MATE family efflux protein